MWDSVYHKNEDVVSRRVLEETILVPIKGSLVDMNRLFAVNSVAEYIWDELDGRKPLSEIRDGVLSKFDVERAEAEADIKEFVGELFDEGLISKRARA
jgi:hypothetical protein